MEAAQRGETIQFRLILSRLDEVAERVAEVTKGRYPDLAVPLHSRWRHFSAGGIDRASLVAPGADRAAAARARIDLTVVSVLLDAGVGSGWRYREAEMGLVLTRSEGLAVASLRAMQAGLFSDRADEPWRAAAASLAAMTPAKLAAAFQHGVGNEFAGVEGRALLLRRLGEVMAAAPEWFGSPARPGNLYDYWLAQSDVLSAPVILRTLLVALGPIWPGRLSLAGVPLGDCARHPAVAGDGFVPFHKLSQWLAYSLVEPLTEAGFAVTELDGLTGLAEYRNGGLFLDGGVIEPHDPGVLRRPLDPASLPVVEWRALTVALLDRLAERVGERLGLSRRAFPLAKLLEGGSWAAGREIALEHRPDGSAPLTIASDGTLF
jgi:hypothetical protein